MRQERRVIAVCGPPGSGKTTACACPTEVAVQVLSASSVVGRDLGEGRGGVGFSRARWQARGAQLLKERGAKWYVRQLLGAAGSAAYLLIDGLRTVELVRALVDAAPQVSIVYIEVPSDVCALRQGMALSAYQEMIDHPVEAAVRHIREIADAVVDNTGTPAALCRQVNRVLSDCR